MHNFLRNDAVLLSYPFTDVVTAKVRPAVVISAPHERPTLIVVQMSSKTHNLTSGEFLLTDWVSAGLNCPTAVKRGLQTVSDEAIIKRLGSLSREDRDSLDACLRQWLRH